MQQNQNYYGRNSFRLRILTQAFAFFAMVCASAQAQAPIAVNKPAPEIVGHTWLNTPRPITLASRAGKVTIVEFWTADCINCKHNFATYAWWQREYAPWGVQVIGIHTPETKWESATSFVRQRTRQYGITYPVLVDSNYVNWYRWNQESWPTVYLIDRRGIIRYQWVGELDADNAGGTRQMSDLIAKLIRQGGEG